MKIPHGDYLKHVTPPDRIHPIKANRACETSHVGSVKRDEISISDLGKELQKIKEVVEATPDIRIDKVVKLQRLVNEGLYHIPEEELINKLLDL